MSQGWPPPWFYPDPADPPEVRRSFGYERLVITRRARQWYTAAGLTGLELEREVDAAYMRWAASLPTYREISDRREARMKAEAAAKWEAGESTRGPGLTRPEWLYLEERLEGANDPQAQAILAKARAALGR